MKQSRYFFSIILVFLLFVGLPKAFSQVTVTSSDSLSCSVTCTTLTAHLEGDNPIDAHVTIDDQYASLTIPIGFTFNFYGYNYASCLIGPNGTLCFDTTLVGSYDDWTISAPLAGNPTVYNSICGPWCDIYIPAGGTITYSTDGVAPYRKFVATYCHTAMYSCTAQWCTTQIILYETTNIAEVHVGHKTHCSWNGGYAIIGVENKDGSASTAAPGRDYPMVYSCTDEAWRFTPVGTGTSYTVASIPYAPVPYASSSLYWYNATTGAYLGTGGTQTVCPTTPTLYKCGALGCSDTSFGYYMVTPIGGVTFTTASTDPTTCGGCNGTITLNGLIASTTYTINYLFNGVAHTPLTITTNASGSFTFTGMCAGAYTGITAALGPCVSSPASVTLNNPPISMTGASTNNTYCGVCDGIITLSGLYASTAYTITYNMAGVAQPPITLTSNAAGVITMTGLCAGTYDNIIATITSSAGACVTPAVGPFTITPPPPPGLNLTGFVNPSQCGYCDGTISIKAIDPFSTDTVFYSFNGAAAPSFTTIALGDSSIYLQGLCAGTYSGFSVKVGGCAYTVTGEATLTTDSIHAIFDTSIRFGCHGDSVQFHNSSTTTLGKTLFYIWKFGDGTIDTTVNPMHVYTAQGTYTVTLIADNHFCEDSMQIVVPLIHPLVASFTMDTNLICQDKRITFTNTSTISNGYAGTYMWSFGDGNTDTSKNTSNIYLHTGQYTIQLIATDWVPCHDTTTAIVQVDTISGIQLHLTDTIICQGTYITYTGYYASIGNTGNAWDFGDGSTIVNVNPVMHAFNTAGTYMVSVTADYRACPDTSITKKVIVLPQPYLNLGPDTSICKGSESLVLADNVNGSNAAASWLWSTGQTGPSIVVVEPGYYAVTVNVNNCYASDTVWVQNDCYMNIPNVFSPNGDGLNDYFYPRQYLTKGLTAFSMNIYNRWGELVFQTTSIDGRGWDGKLNSTDQPEGVYVYVIDATFRDGQKEHHQGNVTLLR